LGGGSRKEDCVFEGSLGCMVRAISKNIKQKSNNNLPMGKICE
jgi:hypothetical protein